MNRLTEALESTQNSTDPIGNFPAFQVGNNIARYAIPYNYLRNMTYFIADQALTFTGEGNEFVIRGENISHLFDMLLGRMISKIIEGKNFKISGQKITITSVIVTPLNDKKIEEE